jgi:hypothetical protein
MCHLCARAVLARVPPRLMMFNADARRRRLNDSLRGSMASKPLRAAAALCLSATALAASARPSLLPHGCVELSTPGNLQANTHRIQSALDTASASGTADAKGCVSVAAGDWYVGGVTVRSNTTLLIQPDARLVSKINVTTTAVVQVDKAEHVEIGGGGGVHGHAEEAWQYFSDKVRRHEQALPRVTLQSRLRHFLAAASV